MEILLILIFMILGDDEKFYFDEEPAELISRLFTGSE